MTSGKRAAFDKDHSRYETWFERHQKAYYAELLAVRAFLPYYGLCIEIGVGTGRFGGPLGIRVGLDPSAPMLRYAEKRGILCVQGVAEALPFRDSLFNCALVVTTICFVDDSKALFSEAYRILKPRACLIVGFIDRNSPLGKLYQSARAENIFYRDATFYSPDEVEKLLSDAGFLGQVWGQTLFQPLEGMREIEPLREGLSEGAFVIVKAYKAR
ncbi:MAG: class I SAM-dependent methyltransferase [Desulfoferrobacter sp.]